jgi:hypothetical protein
MARVRRTFTQGDITRAVKGAFAAGAQSVRVEVGAEGQTRHGFRVNAHLSCSSSSK